MEEYQLTLVYRAADADDARAIAAMVEGVLKQLDHPVAAGEPARLSRPLDPADE
jgi:hypothetical protein